MRHVAKSVTFFRFPGVAVAAFTYCSCIVLAIVGIAHVSTVLARHAAAPLARLLLSTGEGSAASPEVASAVLEGDAWLQNLKSNWQAQNRSRATASSIGADGIARTISSLTDGTVDADNNNVGTAGRGRAKSGLYRTVCVRLCDGYFFPMSFATSRDQFDHDQEKCASSCASPARLYVYENPGQEPEEMVALDGKSYSKLTTAFQFRKKLDQSCRCNPQPWEQQAMDRHRRYAEVAAHEKLLKHAAPGKPSSIERKSNKSQKSASKAAIRTAGKPPAAIATTASTEGKQNTLSAIGITFAIINVSTRSAGLPMPAASPAELPSVSALQPLPPTRLLPSGVASPREKIDKSAKFKVRPQLNAASGEIMRLGALPPLVRPALALPSASNGSASGAEWRNKVFASR